ncbi:TetR family transcriptional regulator [Micromonospora pisi]|uniref:TetR family transcriptional regulator n=1 Tax=Micromonospora pisi TaxID=589240 RepID=A0A495JNV6_9ACTN|nr:TetR family transcriptional regulator [Micromonospora pisi]RKR90521.1 TetR family transcriptional regulator [Micromonospora pisi]
MADTTLTSGQILEAAEDVLRRFGPAKTTVVDVARVLGVSHGSVYRHFPSKAALREAVAERWLERAHAPLPALTSADLPASQRLRAWLTTLAAEKRTKALEDPELFATYMVLVRESSAVVAEHVEDLIRQIALIIEDGVADGDFAATDVHRTARAVLQATARWHDPVHAPDWVEPGVADALEAVCDLVLDGLRVRN